jgi:uncharacterized protein DUF5988
MVAKRGDLMNNQMTDASPDNAVTATLEGGPASLPEASRIQMVTSDTQKIKVPYYGGYEHFERLISREENYSSAQITFHWTMRTEVAE